jgi:YegS/Rv2252/BmrU family lipid kinase
MKAIVIYNPAAGQYPLEEELQQTIALLNERNWEIIGVERTLGQGDATTYARAAAARKCDAVFVAGGDGTIAQTVDGLVGAETALAVLPGGSGNVFARQLGLPVPGGLHPHPMLESARLLSEGRIHQVDVGRVTPLGGQGHTHHFLCWCGVGFDAQLNLIVESDRERRQRLGLGAFFVAAYATLRDYLGMPAVVRVDGHRVSRRLIMLEASNIQLYGIFFKIAPSAAMDDGWLNVYCFQGRGPARTILHALRLLFSRHLQDPEVDVFRARRIEVKTGKPLPIHVDGEPIGYTPIAIETVPNALRLLVPPCAPASLFVRDAEWLQPETPWQWVVRVARDAQSAFKEIRGLP